MASTFALSFPIEINGKAYAGYYRLDVSVVHVSMTIGTKSMRRGG